MNKPGAELVLFKFADLPAFRVLTEGLSECGNGKRRSENHLQKYGADYRCILGVTNATAQMLPPRRSASENFIIAGLCRISRIGR